MKKTLGSLAALVRGQDSASPKPEPDRIGDFHRPSLLWLDGKYHFQYDRIRSMRSRNEAETFFKEHPGAATGKASHN